MLFAERKKDPSVEAAEDKSVQEWDLKDVIFVEDKRNIPVGKVLKVSVLDFFRRDHCGLRKSSCLSR